MNDLISVIVPVYNVEKYFARCIDSITSQTYGNLEIILVDDGSKDSSGSLCDKAAENDNRIKVIHKDNAGLGFARNSGLEIATGKYVAFIDGDDYIGQSHIQTMLERIHATSADTCMGGYTKVYSLDKVKHKHVLNGNIIHKDVKNTILPRMCGADAQGQDYIEMSVCMVLLSMRIIREHRLRFHSEREFISEDLVFDFDYYPYSECVCITDQTDYYYCDNMDSLTTRYRGNRYQSELALFDYLCKRATDLNIFDICFPRLQNTLLAIARYSVKLEYKFENVNGSVIANENVRKICTDSVFKKTYKSYDVSGIRKASKMVMFLMMRELYLPLKLIMRIKNKFNI